MSEIRISCASLASIKDGKYLLLLNKRSSSYYKISEKKLKVNLD